MRLRTKYIPKVGYFAQVKVWLFWHKIGKHMSGYGLYDESNIEHPMETEQAAIELCKLYEQWIYNCKNPPFYKEI